MARKSCLASKKNLVQAIKCSSSVKECLEFLGLRAAGGNYKQFYKWCEYHNLTPPRGDSSTGLQKAACRKLTPLEDVLVAESNYNRVSLKARLLKLGLLEHYCYECGQTDEWNGKPLTLQLDHINGIPKDNRLDNLRLLCPNCHSQTVTFAGKKHRKPESSLSCSQCGQTLGKFCKHYLCQKCQTKQPRLDRRKVVRPSLDVVKKQVETYGYAATGRYYGVSDNAIRKWLKTAGM